MKAQPLNPFNQEYIMHRMGRCKEEKCEAVFKTEMSLELPEDPYERRRWYEAAREKWSVWFQGVTMLHDWSFRCGTCQNCGAENQILVTGTEPRRCTQRLCVQFCLLTEIPWYPTGYVQTNPFVLYHHATHNQTCTSHLSSLTSDSQTRLEKLLMSSSPPITAEPSNSMSFSNAPLRPMMKSFSDMHLPNLDLSHLKSQDSATQRILR